MEYNSLTREDLKLGKYLVTGSNLVSNVVYEAIRCKSYPTLPRKVEVIVEKVTEVYKKEFPLLDPNNSFYCKTFETSVELLQWLTDFIMPIQEIQELNLSQYEVDNGMTLENRKKDQFVFTSRNSQIEPIEYDFIDLSAYVRNLSFDLMRECVDINYSTL